MSIGGTFRVLWVLLLSATEFIFESFPHCEGSPLAHYWAMFSSLGSFRAQQKGVWPLLLVTRPPSSQE
jgi:hypothetical protein